MLPFVGSVCTEVPTSKKRGITCQSCTAVIGFHLLWSCLPGAGKALRQPVGLCDSLCQSAQSTGTAEPEEDCHTAVGNFTYAASALT